MDTKNIDLSEANLKLALEAMITAARKLGINRGVAIIRLATVTDHFGTTFDLVNTTLIMPPGPGNSKFKGINYYTLAAQKIGTMIRSRTNSTPRDRLLQGEISAQGGLRARVHTAEIFVAYAGGTQRQDLQIARAGLLFLGLEP